jgi:predicted metal-binding membrane protein
MVSVPDVGRRTYLALMVAVTVAGIAAWTVTAVVLSEALAFEAVWLLVTLAVLLPTTAPMVATFTALRRAVAGMPGACWGTAAFVVGYGAAWGAAGSVLYVLSPASETLPSHRWTQAAVFLVAAAYQLTPYKDRFLARCRVPLSFLMSSWRDGVGGAFDMGARYGGACIGASAVLVTALFAHGSPQLWAMVLVALLIGTEKLAPSRTLARRGVAAVLAGLAVASVLAPGLLH